MGNRLKGYHHRKYAESLSEFGTPINLLYSNGWCLKRKIPDFPYYDAMGCYPIFSCNNWDNLQTDFENIDEELVTISLVTDPFGNYTVSDLKQCFPDVAIPFKRHFVIDLNRSMEEYISAHHQRNAKKAIKKLRVEKYDNSIEALNDWIELYSVLVERHKIKGISAFSKSSFEKQLAIPGMIVFRAIVNNKSIGMILWFIQGEVAYYHLGAYSEIGYQLNASFALFWQSIKYFSETKLQWLSLGAGAGLNDDETDGLTRFKKDWSTDTRLAYFCGKVLDHDKYSMILEKKNISNSGYFPAYRQGEFG